MDLEGRNDLGGRRAGYGGTAVVVEPPVTMDGGLKLVRHLDEVEWKPVKPVDAM